MRLSHTFFAATLCAACACVGHSHAGHELVETADAQLHARADVIEEEIRSLSAVRLAVMNDHSMALTGILATMHEHCFKKATKVLAKRSITKNAGDNAAQDAGVKNYSPGQEKLLSLTTAKERLWQNTARTTLLQNAMSQTSWHLSAPRGSDDSDIATLNILCGERMRSCLEGMNLERLKMQDAHKVYVDALKEYDSSLQQYENYISALLQFDPELASDKPAPYTHRRETYSTDIVTPMVDALVTRHLATVTYVDAMLNFEAQAFEYFLARQDMKTVADETDNLQGFMTDKTIFSVDYLLQQKQQLEKELVESRDMLLNLAYIQGYAVPLGDALKRLAESGAGLHSALLASPAFLPNRAAQLTQYAADALQTYMRQVERLEAAEKRLFDMGHYPMRASGVSETRTCAQQTLAHAARSKAYEASAAYRRAESRLSAVLAGAEAGGDAGDALAQPCAMETGAALAEVYDARMAWAREMSRVRVLENMDAQRAGTQCE